MRHGMRSWLALAAGLTAGTPAVAQVQHGAISVQENDCTNTPAAVTLSRLTGDGPWQIISDDGVDNSNRGDYVVDFLTGADTAAGILITGNYDDARSSPCVTEDPYFATASSARSSSGRYFIAVHGSPSGSEVNYNPAFAFFPIADGWLAGAAYNSENGGIITELVGNPAIVLYNTFNDPGTGNGFIDSGVGNFGVRLEGIDLRRDGVLLVSGAKDEDNFGMVFINWDGTAVINNHDNGDNADGAEQDPVAFAFVPDGTQGVTMGRFTASARKLYGQGDWSVEMVDQPLTNGTFRLTIAGESPATGTLVVSPYTELGRFSLDNVVSVTPEANGWLITTRDIAGMGLQDIESGEVVCHFAFFKSGVSIVPGTPPRPYAARIGNIHSARFQVTEFTPDNGNGDVRADRVSGSDAIDVAGDNRGDFVLSYFGARHPAYIDNSRDAAEGVYLGASTEFIRDNSATGGVSGWSTYSFDNSNVHLHNASLAGGEINSNFAVAFFPASLGLLQDADVSAALGVAAVEVGADALSDGVLIAVNWDNTNTVVSAVPNGTQYDISFHDGATGAPVTDSTEFGYVYLPYSFDGIVAGQIDASGQVLSGTGGFTTGSGFDDLGFPVTTISIPGVNAATDGVLLVTPSVPGYAVSWEAGSGGEFEVAGLDLSTGAPGPSAFSFAWIPDELEPPVSCPGDFSGDDEVGFEDLVILLGAFGANDGGDMDGDSDTDFQDLVAFLAVYGTSC